MFSMGTATREKGKKAPPLWATEIDGFFVERARMAVDPVLEQPYADYPRVTWVRPMGESLQILAIDGPALVRVTLPALQSFDAPEMWLPVNPTPLQRALSDRENIRVAVEYFLGEGEDPKPSLELWQPGEVHPKRRVLPVLEDDPVMPFGEEPQPTRSELLHRYGTAAENAGEGEGSAEAFALELDSLAYVRGWAKAVEAGVDDLYPLLRVRVGQVKNTSGGPNVDCWYVGPDGFSLRGVVGTYPAEPPPEEPDDGSDSSEGDPGEEG